MSERDAIVAWLREQSDKGADHGLARDKGTTARAAYGGGSLALKRAADAIERGDHLPASVAGGERLGWHIPDNLRWLGEQDGRPDRVPCGYLTGQFLKLCADKWESTHAGEVERLREEIADLKSSVIAFGAPWAGQYARDFGFPPNHIHATHYDILEKAGGRMDSFVRHDPQALEASR